MLAHSLSASAWQLRQSPAGRWLPANVPGCVHRDLRRAGQIPDPFFGANELDLQWIEMCDWEYRATFTPPSDLLAHSRVDLVADGLDTVATVVVNGRVIARADNMFTQYRWNVQPHLRPGANEIRVRFDSASRSIRRARTRFVPPREFNDPVGNSVRLRKQASQFGWDWAPRLVTAGIWRDLRLEGWSDNRLEHVRIAQTHSRDSRVRLDINPELARPAGSERVIASLTRHGKRIAEVRGAASAALAITVEHPELWWPAGQGAHPLYDLEVELTDADGRRLDVVQRRIGLRTIALDRSKDRWGERFRFVVNGRPVFLKGANWIPAHSFVAGLSRQDYARDLRAAAAVHMNALRVWGGGIYESDDFYDLCDELGLLVWQDFMFACTLYPADRGFLASVRREAEYQVKRLHHRACLALWCGNNELAMLNPALREQARYRAGYERLFHRELPAVVAAHDPSSAYWPSSPWRGGLGKLSHADGEKSGDTHFWDVWHARHPVKDYEKWAFRFVSEFGMQSYSSPATNATFCPPDDANVFGPAMENHQKNRSGNQVILDYVSRRYRYPKFQDDLIYLSQLNQAYCMQVGVEHYRRLTPRCMGALYWQLNDCWPVASWSSIEFTGRWKALHFAARRFFAPVLVSVHLPGDEKPTIGNYRESTVDTAEVYTVCDAPEPIDAKLSWQVCRMDGRRVLSEARLVHLRSGSSRRWQRIDLRPALQRHRREDLLVHATLAVGRKIVSEQTAFLCPPRFVQLPRDRAEVSVRELSSTELELTFSSHVFLHAVAFDLPDQPHAASDNYFDLLPDTPKKVRVTFEQPVVGASVAARLHTRSLVDTY